MIETPPKSPIDYISLGVSRVGMFLVAVIVSIMFYEVVLRYFFEQPTLWVNEMSLWIAGFIYLLAALYVLQQRGHIRITLLYDVCPRWVQRLFDIISTLCIVIFGVMIIHGGFIEAVQKFNRWEKFGTAWDPPIPATMKPAILVIAGLMVAQAIANLIRDWNDVPVPEGAADVVEELRGAVGQTETDRRA